MAVDFIPQDLSYWQHFETGSSTGTLSDDLEDLQQKPSLGFSLWLAL